MNSPVHWMLLLFFALEHSRGASSAPLVSLRGLLSLNASCHGLDTCRGRRNDDMRTFNCQCGPYCVRYGTCCIDAPDILKGKVMGGYRKGIKCGRVFGYHPAVNLVQGCPLEWDGYDSVRDQCDADGHERSDLMLLVPVSSLKTGITYKNYFCYVCNTVDNLEDNPISWNLGVDAVSHNGSLQVDLATLTYDVHRWTFPGAPSDALISIRTEPPAKLLEKHSIFCRPEEVTSSCAADWTDDATRSKCGSYTALVSMTTEEGWDNYRNVHCGICNGASLEGVTCVYTPERVSIIGGKWASVAKVFQEMFRISEVPEDRCPEGKIYDRVTKTCRNFRCGRKMKVVKGRCVRKT